MTTLKNLKAQSYVNLEIDTIARYVERMMALRTKIRSSDPSGTGLARPPKRRLGSGLRTRPVFLSAFLVSSARRKGPDGATDVKYDDSVRRFRPHDVS